MFISCNTPIYIYSMKAHLKSTILQPNILVLSWYQSQIIDKRRDPWPLPTLNPLPNQQLPMLHSIPHHPSSPLSSFQSQI
jgi:hypothetical protein